MHLTYQKHDGRKSPDRPSSLEVTITPAMINAGAVVLGTSLNSLGGDSAPWGGHTVEKVVREVLEAATRECDSVRQ
jgi:hypothetical protein